MENNGGVKNSPNNLLVSICFKPCTTRTDWRSDNVSFLGALSMTNNIHWWHLT